MDTTRYDIILYVESASTGERIPIILAKTEDIALADEMIDNIRDILPTAELIIDFNNHWTI